MGKLHDKATKHIEEKERTQAPNATPLRKPPRRVVIGLTEDEFSHLHEMAFRGGTSVSHLGQRAIVRFLIAAEKGEVQLLPEFVHKRSGSA